jgi:hypothetical protein
MALQSETSRAAGVRLKVEDALEAAVGAMFKAMTAPTIQNGLLR